MIKPSPQDRVVAIIQALEADGANEDLMEEASALARAHPEAILDLARTLIRVPSEADWGFFETLLAFLPGADWFPLVESALDALEARSGNRAANFVIFSAWNQALPALHPHLERFFWLQMRTEKHLSVWPWRDSGTTSLDFLRGVVEGSKSSNLRRNAWDAMLETRDPAVIAEAIRLDRTTAIHFDTPMPSEDFSHTLRQVGFEARGPELRRLVPDLAYHLIFPRSAFDGLVRPPELRWDDREWPPPPKRMHPTWFLEPSPELPAMRFGGLAKSGRCPHCDRRLDRYILLDPVPDGSASRGCLASKSPPA